MKNKYFQYPIIDSKLTGLKIKRECQKQDITVKDIQNYLGIGACQSIYNWFSGKTLPSLDNMLALSRLLSINMENLLVCQNGNGLQQEVCDNAMEKRLSCYVRLIRDIAA